MLYECEHCDKASQDVETRYSLQAAESPRLCTGCFLEAADYEQELRERSYYNETLV